MNQNEEKINPTPQQFGRYVVKNLIGEGSMGRIYLAEDPVLQRQVALKVFKFESQHFDEENKENYFRRFIFEAQASAKLDHPSIVPVYDAGQQNDLPWIAFQFIDGKSLEALIASNQRLELETIITLSLDVASALKYAHKRDIIHRDIKPANILIDNHSRVAKVTDFGIAKVPWMALTQEGIAIGSPGYMSPEQIYGQELDGRSDIFSLGVILYQMITRKHPFLRHDLPSTIHATMEGVYTPIAEITPGVPAAFDFLIRHSLAKDRNDRISSASEFISMIKSIKQPGITVSHHSFRGSDTAIKRPDDIGNKKIKIGSIINNYVFKLSNSVLRASGSLQRFMSRGVKGLYKRHSAPAIGQLPQTQSSSQSSSRKNHLSQRRFKDSRRGVALFLFVNRIVFRYNLAITLLRRVAFHISRIPYNIRVTAIVVMVSLILIGVVSSLKHTSGTAWKFSVASINENASKQIEKCRTLIDNGSYDDAREQIALLKDSKTGYEYGYLFQGIIAIIKGDMENADRSFRSASNVLFGNNVVSAELPYILKYVGKELAHKEASAITIDMVATTLHAATSTIVDDWVTDRQYWLRWNAVRIKDAAGKPVDMVEVYILDLKYSNSYRIRLRAVEQLGKLGDSRAVPVLKEASTHLFMDPFVASKAQSVLESVFNQKNR